MKNLHFDIVNVRPEHPSIWFSEAAKIHIDELPSGALRTLGVHGLSEIYSSMASLPICSFYCAIEKGHVIGFLSGCANVKKTYSQLLLRSGGKLLINSAGPILKENSISSMIKVLLYPFRRDVWTLAPNHEKRSNMELLSIAVKKSHHRRGIGQLLLKTFESKCLDWDPEGWYYVATDAGDNVSNSFYIGSGFNPYGRMKFSNFQLQIYEKNIYNRRIHE